MWPTPRTRAEDRQAGFTLIEVVAVMLIIALVASLAVTMMPGTGRGQLRALTLEVAALLRRERLGAVMTIHGFLPAATPCLGKTPLCTRLSYSAKSL